MQQLVFLGGGYAYILPATTDTDVLSADRDIQGYSTLETRSHWLLISVKLLGLPVTVRLWWPKALRDGRSCLEGKGKPPSETVALSLSGHFVIALRSLSLSWILDYPLIRNRFKDDYRLALVSTEYKSAMSLTDTWASSGKVKQFWRLSLVFHCTKHDARHVWILERTW